MCGRYSLVGPFSPHIREFTDLILQLGDVGGGRYNIAPSQPVPVVTLGVNGPGLEDMRWGLVPHWAKDLKIGYSTINARVEGLVDKPSFRDAWRRGQRCLVPATGWYEWIGEGKAKQAWYLHAADGTNPLMFAGLWARWSGPDGAVVNSCTILTTEAQGAVRAVHDRQPRVLREADWLPWLEAPVAAATHWLSPEEVPVKAHRVSSLVGNVRNQGAALIEPLAGEGG